MRTMISLQQEKYEEVYEEVVTFMGIEKIPESKWIN